MKHNISTIMKELVDGVVVRSAVDKVLEEVFFRRQWRVKINKVWRMFEDDHPLQEFVKKKKATQELELSEMVEEMVREDRKERECFPQEEV